MQAFWRTKKKKAETNPPSVPPEAVAEGRCIMVAGICLGFGLTWSPVSSSERGVAEDFNEARHVGFNYGVSTRGDEMFGLARQLEGARGKIHSGALVLAENFSAGRAEAFFLKFDKCFAVVGLVGSLPMPGFDRVFTRQTDAEACLDEFRNIHVDQDARVVTNVAGLVEDAEVIDLEMLGGAADARTRIRRLINRPLRRMVIMSVGTAVVLLGGGGWYFWSAAEAEKARIAAEQAAREADPNFRYERGIQSVLTEAGLPGNTLLDRWRAIVLATPLQNSGWVLTKINCQPNDCTISWARAFGTFSDFHNAIPAGTTGEPELVITDGVIRAQVLTRHPVAASPDARPLDRRALPALRNGVRELGSFMQQMSLVSLAPELGPFALFGPQGVGPLEQISRPVVKADWRLQAPDLWTLSTFQLPPYVIPTSLTVQATAAGAGATTLTYSLTGAIYAKGKDY